MITQCNIKLLHAWHHNINKFLIYWISGNRYVYKNFLDKIYGLKNCLTKAIHNENNVVHHVKKCDASITFMHKLHTHTSTVIRNKKCY